MMSSSVVIDSHVGVEERVPALLLLLLLLFEDDDEDDDKVFADVEEDAVLVPVRVVEVVKPLDGEADVLAVVVEEEADVVVVVVVVATAELAAAIMTPAVSATRPLDAGALALLPLAA